jgi:GTPase SAR1 family protein
MTEAEKAEMARSKAIEKANKDAADIEASKIKLLLLGAGESGKSTIFKQMKILYGVGFTVEDQINMTPVIYNNAIVGMRTIIEACRTLNIAITLESLAAEFMEKVSTEAPVKEYEGNLIKKLWDDAGVQEAFKRRAEYQLFDSADYFFKSMDRIMAPDYKASVADILKSRVRTSGIVEEIYRIDGVEFVMYDVGGQRNERKKWIHCFENVTAVIFVAAISEYDQVLYEDMSQNRMDEAVELFDEICNLKWFKETSMLLFLNKKDLFEKKIKIKDIRMENPHEPGTYMFDDYTFGCCTCGGGFPTENPCTCGVQEEGKNYLKNLFLKVNHRENGAVYDHITCATDTSNVDKVFSACKDIILNNNLKGSGFV